MSETLNEIMQSIETLVAELEECSQQIASMSSRKLTIELTLSNIYEKVDSLRSAAANGAGIRRRKPRSDRGIPRKRVLTENLSTRNECV